MTRNSTLVYIITFALTSSVITSQVSANHNLTIVFDAEKPNLNNKDDGSYAQLAQLVEKTRQEHSNTVFLFGGESLGPSMLSSMDKGAHIIDILNSIEPDLMGVSKRELSFQEDELTLRSYEATFPFVSSNLHDPITGGPPEGISNYAIIEYDEFVLGVISVIEPKAVNKYLIERSAVRDPKGTIMLLSSEMRNKGVDAIAVHYTGYMPEIDILLEQGVIDLALYKGRYFSRDASINKVRHPNNIVIDNPFEAALVILTKKDEIGEPIGVAFEKVDIRTLSSQPLVEEKQNSYHKRLSSFLDTVLGKSLTPLDLKRASLRTSENAFGNFLADALLNYTDADIALLNSGGIRSNRFYESGSAITRRTVRTILPFRNHIVTLSVSGALIKEALEHGLSNIENNSGQFLQISGIQVKYNSSKPKGMRLMSVSYKGKPIDDSQEYKVVTLDYLANGGDGYTMLKLSDQQSQETQTTLLISDIARIAIERAQTIAPKVDGRLRDISLENTSTGEN